MWLDTIITQTQNHYVHSRFLVREPWAVPSRWTSCPRVGMYSLTTWGITLFIIIKTYPNRTIAAACPRIKDAPSTILRFVEKKCQYINVLEIYQKTVAVTSYCLHMYAWYIVLPYGCFHSLGKDLPMVILMVDSKVESTVVMRVDLMETQRA